MELCKMIYQIIVYPHGLYGLYGRLWHLTTFGFVNYLGGVEVGLMRKLLPAKPWELYMRHNLSCISSCDNKTLIYLNAMTQAALNSWRGTDIQPMRGGKVDESGS